MSCNGCIKIYLSATIDLISTSCVWFGRICVSDMLLHNVIDYVGRRPTGNAVENVFIENIQNNIHNKTFILR